MEGDKRRQRGEVVVLVVVMMGKMRSLKSAWACYYRIGSQAGVFREWGFATSRAEARLDGMGKGRVAQR